MLATGRKIIFLLAVLITNVVPPAAELVPNFRDFPGLPSVPVARAAGTIVVTDLSDTVGSVCTLRQAILEVNTQTSAVCGVPSPEVISFSVSGVISLTSTLVITHNATIQGPTSGITVEGQSTLRIMQVVSTTNVSIDNLTFAHGHTTSGGAGIDNRGVLNVTRSSFVGNGSPSGYGGGILNGGTMTVTSSTFSGNSADFSGGGGIYTFGTATVMSSTFSGNSVPNGLGGGIENLGILNVANTTFTANNANEGGGIFNGTLAALTVTDSTFSGNKANLGGGILSGGTSIVTRSTLSGNSADMIGGGGGIYVYGKLSAESLTFSGNTAPSGSGGGISTTSDSIATVASSTFAGNSAGVYGGGLYNGGSFTLASSTFSQNTAGLSGGGGAANFGTLAVTNATLSGNSAPNGFGGGGILSDGTLTVTNATFAGNAATVAGSILNNGGTVELKNTILANGTSGGNCVGAITDAGYNLVSDTSCGLTSGTSISNTVASLDPAGLKNNGGATQTILPLPSSPAVNAIPNGENGCGTTLIADQRGVARPQGAKCDIGAVELNGGTSLYIPAAPTNYQAR